jgi:hypothetical protein
MVSRLFYARKEAAVKQPTIAQPARTPRRSRPELFGAGEWVVAEGTPPYAAA